MYLNVFSTCGARLKSVSMQNQFEQFVGKQRRLEGTYLGFSEPEQLRFESIYHQDSVGHSSIGFMTYGISSRYLKEKKCNLKTQIWSLLLELHRKYNSFVHMLGNLTYIDFGKSINFGIICWALI